MDIINGLGGAEWDLVSFMNNAKSYASLVGGGLLALLGTVGVVWGGVMLIKKLMAGQQNQDSWLKILALILVGGALMAGGFGLISQIAAGGKTTIEDLGGGLIIIQSVFRGW